VIGILITVHVADVVEFRQFVRSQHREKFVEVCLGVCGQDVFPRSARNRTSRLLVS